MQNKKHEKTDNLPIQVYSNKIKNGLIVKTKSEYYFEFLTLETKKLKGSAVERITRDQNNENLPQLEITEALLVRCNLVTNDCKAVEKTSNFIGNESADEFLIKLKDS